MNNALICAHNEKYDVFNALNVLDNSKFIDECKFGPGNGYLQYYMYNWRCPAILSKEVGLVLL